MTCGLWRGYSFQGELVMDLDDPKTYQHLDLSDMHQRITGLPQQCRQAWEKALSLPMPQEHRQVNRVVVAGMGGSAIGGDLIADLASLEEALPITTIRDYRIPSWVDSKTLVIVSSYSGETEETLSAFMEALHRGARIIAITKGGQLQAEAEAKEIPLLTVDFEGEPRAALGYSFIAPLGILTHLGLVKDKSQELEEVLHALEEEVSLWSKANATRHNMAKQVALEMQGRMVVIYGAGILSSAARRWKTQLNENSKSWAFAEELPELNHNSVVGYSVPGFMKEGAFVVLLQSAYCHPKTKRRYRVTNEILDRAGVKHRTIEAQGKSPLAHMLTTVLLGDYVSYYLALLNGIDPSPVEVIDYLKQRLAEL